jgi:hypothetical protein
MRAASRILAATAILAACHGRNPAGLDGGMATADGTADVGAQEPGIIRGAGGKVIARVASAYVIESPDSDGTTVVYLFSRPVRCLDLSVPDWDRSLEEGTQVVKVTLSGGSPGRYRVLGSTPTRGEASLEASRATPRGAVQEVRASQGWLVLDALVPRGAAAGSFGVDLDRDRWDARFEAEFCQGGHEP